MFNKIIVVLILSFITLGCGAQTPAIKEKTPEEKTKRYEWVKLNELKDNAGNKVCAYKVAGNLEWWDIVVVYDKDDNIKQVLTKTNKD